MASLANLIVSMIAETGQFNTDMDRTAKQQAARMKKLERSAAEAGKAIGVAFAAIGGATVALVAKTTAAADKIRDLSIVTGISTEALSAYKFAAEQSGVSFEALTNGVNKMQRAIVEAQNGTSETARAFGRLGLSIDELMKLSPDKQFEAVAESLGRLESETLKNATAQQIFGRAGAQLLPILKSGEEGIAAATEKVVKYGAVIGQGFADNADRFIDNMGEIKLIGQGVANTFVASLLPSLISMQEEFIESGDAMKIAEVAGAAFGSVAKTLASALALVAEHSTAAAVGLSGFAGLKILTPLLFAFGTAAPIAAVGAGALIGAFLLMRSRAAEVSQSIESLTQTISLLTDEYIEAASATELLSNQAKTRQQWLETEEQLVRVQERLAKLRADAPDDLEQYHAEIKILADEEERLKDAQGEAAERLGKIARQLTTLKNGAIEPVTVSARKMRDVFDKTEVAFKRLEPRIKAVNKLWNESEEILNELIASQGEYEGRLQELRDVGDPIGAMVRDFSESQAVLNRALAEGRVTAEEYQRILNALSDDLGKAAASTIPVAENFDVMREALLEGVRILERTFTDLWGNILDGSQSAFSGMLDGFKTLLAQMLHAMLTTPLIKAMQKAFEPGGGGFDAIDIKSVGTALAGIAGVTIGQILGGGGVGAGIGSALGSLIGKAALSSIPVIGTIVGGIIGGLLGGLFDKSKKLVLEASGVNKGGQSGSDDDAFITSIFGDTFIRSRRLDAQAINEFKASLKDFDNAIGSFLDDSQIANVSAALKDWAQKIEGETLNAEDILNSRFAAILDTFSDDIQAFVRKAQGLEEQVARLQVGVGAERLFSAQPDIFGEHTVNEFLAVVEAFRNGTESITDAFAEVVQVLDGVVSAKNALKDFSTSDLGSDFARLLQLQSESVLETLSRLTSDFADALNSFDGSPQQLTEIGNLALSIRQQELTALSLIDSVAKGLNANLDRLLADTKATIQGPRAAEDVLFDARALIATVSQASTPEEIAKIGQDFEALIRSLSPEDTKRFGTSTLAIIEAFKAASNTALEQAKQAVIDSGTAIREMAGNFAAMIDPLALIAATNERAAAALEALAGGDAVQGAVANSETIAETFREGLADQSQVLADGTAQMSSALASGVSSMAVQVANAIRSGFAGANVTVNVVVQDPSLVTQ